MPAHAIRWDEMPPEAVRGGVVTIGNFDGVHRGHQALVAEVRSQARSLGGPAVVLTLEPHPLQLLRPERFQPVLTTAADRAGLLQACGADAVVLLHTTPELLRLGAEEFFRSVVRERLGARALVEGENFGFGRDREGDITTLGRLCRQDSVTLTIVPPVLVGGRPASSSRVRDALVRGAVDEARELTERPYRLHGTVETGRQRGRTIGFPTANLGKIPTLVPGDGVYVVRVPHEGAVYTGAANIGPNPTFGESARKVEVHLIDFRGDLLGKPLTVDFLARLRDTRPFAGVDELVAQLRRDVEEARRLGAR
jgi:riboflavin kinase/FMN adenylyltransferase